MNQTPNDFWKITDTHITEALRRSIMQIAAVRKNAGLPTRTKIAYHYTDGSGLKSIIEKKGLWATHTRYCNDATESVKGRDLALSILHTLGDEEVVESYKTWLYRLEEIVRQTEVFPAFCCCFSRQPDQLSQWRGYGGKGFGYAIGFNVANTFELGSPYDITYKDDVKAEICRVVFSTFLSPLRKAGHPKELERNLKPIAIVLDSLVDTLASTFKDEGFSEEDEFRLLEFRHIELDPADIQFRERVGMFIPFIELKPKSGELLPINEIIVGPCLDAERSKQSLLMFLQKSGYPAVKVENSSIPFLP